MLCCAKDRMDGKSEAVGRGGMQEEVGAYGGAFYVR